MEEKKLALILWDFSKSCDIALQHAIQLATAGENDIMLLHIIPQSGLLSALLSPNKNTAEISKANKRFNAVVEDVRQKYAINPRTMVLEGNPTKILRKLVETANVNLVISHHTYTYKGKKHRVTSWTKKLIFKDITLPIVIVNQAPAHSHYMEIAIPIYQDHSFKESVQWIINLARYYHCNVNFIKPYILEELKKKQLASNIYFTKKMLDSVGIVYGMKTAKKGNVFEDEVFRFADNIEADLIMVMSDKHEKLVSPERERNLHIPVMCVNTRIKKYQPFN
ncbi:MAG: universal stress protein [Bacteroidales bacterium]|nr:universal stress protein [Bacteroidales bacterium]